MKTLASFIGLLGAIAVTPVALQAQQFVPASTGSFYGGPSEYASSDEHIVAPCDSIPYGYLWNDYCEEYSQHYACKMHHALNAAAIARHASGACPSEKFQLMMESVKSHIPSQGTCGQDQKCQGPRIIDCGDCKYTHDRIDDDDESVAEPPQPIPSDAANSGTVQPTQEPVLLTPVGPTEQPINEVSPTEPWSPRSPVVRLAPAAPQPMTTRPSEAQPERRIPRNEIPRNVVPPRSANPHSAAIPVRSRIYDARITRR